MLVNYKATSPFRLSNLFKFDKIISTSLTNESKYYEIKELISTLNDFLPQDDQIKENENRFMHEDNNQQFVFNFTHLLIQQLISIINNNCQNIDQQCVIDLANSCLSNLNLFCQNEFNELNFNPFLNIISLSYDNQYLREMTLELFPISFITVELLSFIKPKIQNYGQSWLKCLYYFCSYEHTIDESTIVFEGINSVKNILTDKTSVLYVCYILNRMMNFNTIPVDLFKKFNFQDYLTNLVRSNDLEIVQRALFLFGKMPNYITIPFDQIYCDFFFDLLFKNINNDKICCLTFWILSTSLNEDISNEFIESGMFSKIVRKYPEISMNSKIELSLFISDILCLTTNFDFEKYINDDTLMMIIDSLSTGNHLIVSKFIKILCFIIYELAENGDNNEYLYFVLGFLIDNGIFDLLNQFQEDESEYDDIIDNIYNFGRTIECLIQQDEFIP